MRNNIQVDSLVNKRTLRLPCYTLCILIVGVLGVLPVLPQAITQILRPMFLGTCLFISLAAYYPMSRAIKWQIVTIVYYLMILLLNTITKTAIMAYASTVLYMLMFIFAAQIRWSNREIRLIINVVIISCLWMAIASVYSNPNILHSSGSSHLYYFGIQMNRNSIAFELVPGAVSALFMLLYNKQNCRLPRLRMLFYAMSCMVIAFTIFAIGCRSAFFAAAGGMSLVLWSKAGTGRTKESRLFGRTFVVCLIVATLLMAMSISTGTYSERLFEFGGEDSDSGRDVLAEQAWEMIDKKPVFGGGFDYWDNSGGDKLGTHNTFLTIMVFSGYVGGAFLAVFLISFLIEMLKTKNLIPIAFSMQTLFFIRTESDMSYYAYIPLFLAFIILRRIQYNSRKVSSIFE